MYRTITHCIVFSAEGPERRTSGYAFLQVQRLGGEGSGLHQPEGGVRAAQARPGTVLHHPLNVRAPSGGRLPPQGLLREAKQLIVSELLCRVSISFWTDSRPL